MTAPKGYLFHFFNNIYHIEKSEHSPGVTICGALIRYNRGTAKLTTKVDGRRVCANCRHQAKERRLSENF